jgi:hypothetical protein
MNGLHVCVNDVMVNGSMVNVEWFEWFTCMCECCNGKCGMICMVYMYVWML